MNARTRRTLLSAAAVVVTGLTVQAQAQSPLDDFGRIVGQVGRIVRGGGYQPDPCVFPNPDPWQPAPGYPTPGPQPGPILNPYPTPTPQPGPYPQPVGSSRFLGVYTSTVQVSPGNAGQPVSGPQTYVAPGYGQAVYGQRVNQIVPNSPAFHAGLEPGDIIIHANGIPMNSRLHLRSAINSSQGRLQMQVIDGRTGQLTWVVAETELQNSVPMIAGPQSGSNSPAITQRSSAGVQASGSQQSLQLGPGGRRPPIRLR
jgi:membrane-associated protease RseP (regulator of RpoE activity)